VAIFEQRFAFLRELPSTTGSTLLTTIGDRPCDTLAGMDPVPGTPFHDTNGFMP
jgi:hypothetical protein